MSYPPIGPPAPFGQPEQPEQPGQPGQPGQPEPPRQPTSGPKSSAATAALVLGILAVTIGLCLWFVPVLPILAIVFGHVGLRRSEALGGVGRSSAITGLITGYLGLAFSLVILLLAMLGTFTAPAPSF